MRWMRARRTAACAVILVIICCLCGDAGFVWRNVPVPEPVHVERLLRALTAEDDIIFTIPAQREEEFYKGVDFQLQRGGRDSFYYMMKEDFERPPFYNRLFEAWGLDTGDDWDKPGG